MAVLLAWLDRHRARGAGVFLAAVMLVGTASVGVTAYLGAENVYRHGLGVQRLPEGSQSAGADRSPEAAAEKDARQTGESGSADKQQDSEQGGSDGTEPDGHEGHDHAH